MPVRPALLAICLLLASPLPGVAAESLERLREEWELVVRRRDPAGLAEQRAVLSRIAEVRTPEARRLLQDLRDRHATARPRLTAAILEAFVRHGTPEDVDATIQWVERHRDPLVLELLSEVLAQVQSEETRAHLRGTALRRAPPPRKTHIIRALGASHDRRATTTLLLLLPVQNLHVRLEALEALGEIADARAFGPVRVFLRDTDPRVRAAAARALGRLGDPRAAPHLARVLGDPDARVAESAAEALADFPGPDGIEGLVALLEKAAQDDLRLADVVAAALQKISGKAFGSDATAWRIWWDVVKDQPWQRYEMDPSERTVPGTRYYGFPVRSSKLVFVLDISRSMGWNERLDEAKRELARVLDLLPPTTRFNIVVYSDTATAWQPALKAAQPSQIRRASSFVRRQGPVNGTNTHHALELAFADSQVDTVFFLSDGNPSVGRVVDPERLLLEVRTWNRYRRVRIHCVALLRGDPPSGYAGMEDRDRASDFMRRLAEQNGGRLRVVE